MEDTETLLALVCSLLTVPKPELDVLLDALLSSDGDVHAAAKLLNSGDETRSKPASSASKRKDRSVGLQGWLNAGNSKVETTISDSPPRKKRDVKESSLSPVKAIIKDATVRSGSPIKPKVDLMSVLRQPPSSTRSVPRLLPLTLTNPSMVSQHTPCTMHLSILPPELSCKLFYTMLDLSQSWKRNKWWLFDRLVESPHRTSFYARKTDGVESDNSWQEAAQYWYNGRQTDPPEVFPDVMEEACLYVENMVNEEIQKRHRLPLEWAGRGSEGQIWRANVAASNCYEGTKDSVGFHSDHLTYLGPYPTIASLSLGTTRIFRLREVVPSEEIHSRTAQTFNIPLPHNSLVIMHASTQEKFKHSIPPQSTLDLYRPLFPHHSRLEHPSEPSNCRINITFRFYRPDFKPPSIPRCNCGVPTILRPDMKNRHDGQTDKYWWTCCAGAQKEGKGCSFWRVMDMKAEGRGPTISDVGSNER